MTKEENFKLNKNALYGKSVYKILEESSKSLYGGYKMNYCYNHDVATGAYDCPYADVVNNAICCNCEECNYNSITKKPVVNNSLEDEDDVCLSCSYFNPEAPDCCTYAPESCYYDDNIIDYPF